VTAAHGDRPALRGPSGGYTYAELDAVTDAVAARLRTIAVPGRQVALLCGQDVGAVVGIWSVLKSGAAYVPLDPRHPETRLAALIGQVQGPFQRREDAEQLSTQPVDLPGRRAARVRGASVRRGLRPWPGYGKNSRLLTQEEGRLVYRFLDAPAALLRLSPVGPGPVALILMPPVLPGRSPPGSTPLGAFAQLAQWGFWERGLFLLGRRPGIGVPCLALRSEGALQAREVDSPACPV
jgi:AMP-binding enzyme